MHDAVVGGPVAIEKYLNVMPLYRLESGLDARRPHHISEQPLPPVQRVTSVCFAEDGLLEANEPLLVGAAEV